MWEIEDQLILFPTVKEMTQSVESVGSDHVDVGVPFLTLPLFSSTIEYQSMIPIKLNLYTDVMLHRNSREFSIIIAK